MTDKVITLDGKSYTPPDTPKQITDAHRESMWLLKEVQKYVTDGHLDGLVIIGCNQEGQIFSGHAGAVCDNYFAVLGAIEDYKMHLNKIVKDVEYEDSE